VNWRGSGGWGAGNAYQRVYNPATVETISGTVESVEKVTPMKGMYPAVEATVKTNKETISVHLGPEWYIERLDTKIEKGDTVEIKGSRVTFAGKPAIIAAEIMKGDNVLQLRDNAGRGRLEKITHPWVSSVFGLDRTHPPTTHLAPTKWSKNVCVGDDTSPTS